MAGIHAGILSESFDEVPQYGRKTFFLTCKPINMEERRQQREDLGQGRGPPPPPLCCDSIMEISSFPHCPGSLTVGRHVFTFRGDHSL